MSTPSGDGGGGLFLYRVVQRRMNGPRLAVAMFCLLLLCAASIVPTHGAPVVDVRTYIEMIAGVAKHGLPYLDNGPVDRFPELEVPFGVSAGGHLWGMYGPVYPYFAAPFLRLGGLVLVSRATFALLIPITIATYVLARNLIGSERSAAVAAILAVASTPLLAKGWAPTAYPLAVLCIVMATALVLAALSKTQLRARLLYALGAGVAGGLAGGSHLLCVPMAMALLASLVIADPTAIVDNSTTGTTSSSGPFWRSLLPTQRKLLNTGAFALGFALCIIPFAWLNAIRFSSYNPFSYGPHRWRWGGFSTDTMGQQLAFALPSFVFLTIAALLLFSFRKRRPAQLLIVVASAFVIFLSARLKHDLGAMMKVACALFVDVGLLKLDGYGPAPGSFGAIANHWVVKSMSQGTPLLLLITLMHGLDPRTKHKVICVAAPCIALFAYLCARASLPTTLALGFPFIGMRYTLPAIPMLVALAMLAIRDVELSVRHGLAILVLGLIVAWLLTLSETDGSPDDRPLYQQVVLLIVPFVTALMAIGALLWVRLRLGVRAGQPTDKQAATAKDPTRLAALLLPWALVPCMASGVATALAHDFRLEFLIEAGCDRRVDAFARFAGPRFAVIGELGPIDGVLALRASRDIEYTELHQWTSLRDMRPLLDHWFADDRPVFLTAATPRPTSPWPDIFFEPVSEADGFYRLQRTRGEESP